MPIACGLHSDFGSVVASLNASLAESSPPLHQIHSLPPLPQIHSLPSPTSIHSLAEYSRVKFEHAWLLQPPLSSPLPTSVKGNVVRAFAERRCTDLADGGEQASSLEIARIAREGGPRLPEIASSRASP